MAVIKVAVKKNKKSTQDMDKDKFDSVLSKSLTRELRMLWSIRLE